MLYESQAKFILIRFEWAEEGGGGSGRLTSFTAPQFFFFLVDASIKMSADQSII